MRLVEMLQGVQFAYTSDPEGRQRLGFLAQEVQKAIPQASGKTLLAGVPY